MPKALIFGLALFFLFPQVPEKSPLLTHDKGNGTDQYDKASGQNQTPERLAVVEQIDSPESAQKGQHKDAPAAHPEPDYVAWGFWVNLGLTAITLLIAIAAVFQASAAKLGAKAILRSERAWLLLEGDKMQPPFLIPAESQASPKKTTTHCGVTLKNCGNTPASAIEWHFELQIGDSIETPDSFEIYKSKSPKESLTPFPIGQDQPGYAFAVLTPREYISVSQREGISAGTKTLWLCGIVRYHDVFKQKKRYGWFKRGAETHQTLVCLRYIEYPGNNYGRWVLGGPLGYNKAE